MNMLSGKVLTSDSVKCQTVYEVYFYGRPI